MPVKHVESLEEFNNEIAKEITVVDFYADWCGPCKMLGPIFEMVANEEPTINFVKVNVDNLAEVAEKYKVMSIPTIILFKKGNVIKESNGFMPKDTLKNFIK